MNKVPETCTPKHYQDNDKLIREKAMIEFNTKVLNTDFTLNTSILFKCINNHYIPKDIRKLLEDKYKSDIIVLKVNGEFQKKIFKINSIDIGRYNANGLKELQQKQREDLIRSIIDNFSYKTGPSYHFGPYLCMPTVFSEVIKEFEEKGWKVTFKKQDTGIDEYMNYVNGELTLSYE